MHLLPQSDAAAVTGGGKPDLGVDPSTRPSQPVPIWHPIFFTEP